LGRSRSRREGINRIWRLGGLDSPDSGKGKAVDSRYEGNEPPGVHVMRGISWLTEKLLVCQWLGLTELHYSVSCVSSAPESFRKQYLLQNRTNRK
jgi:hypothetical protein